MAVQIIIAILAQGMGGFLLNQKTVTSCESQFDYSTDVYGAFSGSGQDIPVDFNPRENVTGYYAMDPTDSKSGQEQKRQPAIYYDPAKLPNNYPYQRQARDTTPYTITIESTKALDDYDHVDHYKASVTDNSKAIPVTKKYEWDGGDMTKYSGLYHTSIGHITQSYINIAGVDREAPRIMNVGELMANVPEFKDKDLSLVLKNGGAYPAFLANLDYNTDISLFHRNYEFYYNSEISTYGYVDAGTGSMEIHIKNYFVNDSWLVFGSENEGDNKITLTVIASAPDQTNMYIDPNRGVSPAHASTEYSMFHDEYYYPTTLTGSMDNGQSYIMSTGARTFDHSFAIKVGIITEPGNPSQEVKWHDQAYIKFHGRGVSETQTSATITFINPDDPDHPTSISATSSGGTQMVYFRLNWTIDHNRIHMYAVALGQEMTVDYTHDYLSGTFASYSFEHHDGSSSDIAYAHIELTMSDTYEDSTLPIQTASFTGKTTDKPTVKIDNTYNVMHIEERVPFESDQTYWYNGYNNSTVGMVVSCLPVQGKGGSVPAETKFNLLLHMTDLTDRWCYNNALKPAITIWTDEQTGMVYVGHYDTDGARQKDSAIQVGVCSYAYFELRVDNGALTLWIAPVYQFTADSPFVNYTPEPMFDQTAAISGVSPIGGSVKSITMLSFNVQAISDYSVIEEQAELQDDPPSNSWTSGDCTVDYIVGRLNVSGNGAMADYENTSSVPWREYLERASSISIGEGVTHIGAHAFENSRARHIYGTDDSGKILDHISVESIGDRAFYGCTRMDNYYSLDLPNIESIGTSAFSYCTFGSTLTIGGNINSIGNGAFYGCYNVTTVIFEAAEWNITIGTNAFHLGTSAHKITVTVYSNSNIAENQLDGGYYTTFVYKSYLLPLYPRHLITHTIILLDGGGLYKEDATLTLNKSFPNDALTELVINAVVHPGESMALMTTKEIEGVQQEVVLADIKNDGVDKWIYKDQYYDWWDIQIFYVSNHIDEVDIDGQHYAGGMYLEDGTRLEANHVYLHVGKYGLYEDLGEMGKVDGRSDLTIKMNGIWAFSTQYYLGTNVQGSTIEFDDPGIWHWSWNEALVVFSLVMLGVSIILFYKYGFNIYDILIMGGALALLWVSFQG